MAALIATLRDGSWLTRERVMIAALAVIASTVVALGFLVLTSTRSIDVLGRPLGTDFSSVYAAGSAVLAGQPEAPYDPALHQTREQAIFGARAPFYSWQYPPFFLPVAAALALMPYSLALFLWQGGTLALYLLAIGAISLRRHEDDAPGDRWWLVALGFPAVFVNLGHGQNGFLSAALLGFGLVNLERRPLFAGIFFGLLAYKPQLGILIPLVLLVTGRWRTIATAALTVVILVLAATAVFGIEIWSTFLAATRFSRVTLLETDGLGWEKLQTVFAWVRLWGGSANVAYFVQGAATLAIAVTLAWLWRSSARFSLKAAALAITTVIATPYSLDYDMTVLAVAIAFLAADGSAHGFAPWQKTMLAVLWLTPLVARSAATAHIPLAVVVMLAAFVLTVVQARPLDRRFTSPRA